MACPTCSTGSPSGWCGSRPGFGGPANPEADRAHRRGPIAGIPVRTTAAPESWEPAGVRITVQHPPAAGIPEASDNARSLVLDVAHAGRHLLLTGDLEQLGLIELTAGPRPEPPPDVLLAPHHGGKSANPAALTVGPTPERRRQPASAAMRLQRRPDRPLERQGIPVGGPGATEPSACDGPRTASSRAGSWTGTIPVPRAEDASCTLPIRPWAFPAAPSRPGSWPMGPPHRDRPRRVRDRGDPVGGR